MRHLLLFALSALALVAAPIRPINTDSGGVALKGYDPVAYFTESKPVKGLPQFEHAHQGAIYRFASAAHRDLFQAAPARYLPQYGGYCAWAVSKGHTANISPNAWKVVDGRLFLNHPLAKGKFERGYTEAIPRADENWPRILNGK